MSVSFPGFDSITGMARHVLDCAPPSFALAGHSMVGRVALEVLRLAPGRVLGLALFNTGTHARRPEEIQSRGAVSTKPTVEPHVQTEIKATVRPLPYSEVARDSYADCWRTRQSVK